MVWHKNQFPDFFLASARATEAGNCYPFMNVLITPPAAHIISVSLFVMEYYIKDLNDSYCEFGFVSTGRR